MNIPLSQKHGVNPSMKVCFWCGEETGDILLLGRLPNDDEAPRYAVVDYEPCDKCAEKIKSGIVFMEVSEHEAKPGFPPLNGTPHYPTGSYTVVRESAIDVMFADNPEKAANIKKAGGVFMPTEYYKNTFDEHTTDVE